MGNKTSVKKLRRNFGDLGILKDINIETREGETICMIEPSGSGKSMFLCCLSHLEKITTGNVVVNGHPISDPDTSINEVHENIDIVPQYFNLFPHLTVCGNITLVPTELKLLNRADADEKTMELLNRVGLADEADAYPGRLFGGQKQRVAIARSPAMNPDAMLFDEPTSALDSETVEKTLEVTKQLTADGVTMAAVTHGMGFVREVVNQVIFMNEGYTVEEGTPEETSRNPREEHTRNFLNKVLQRRQDEYRRIHRKISELYEICLKYRKDVV